MSGGRPTAHLTYFNSRGRAETARICLCAAGVEFTETFLESREQFNELKTGWIFGQCPCLEINGLKIVQSNSILRYLAKNFNMNGTNMEEETRIDQLFEGAKDLQQPFMTLGVPLGGSDEEKLKNIKEKSIPKYLTIFEDILTSEPGGQYLVGSRLSVADIAFLEPLLMIEDYLGLQALDVYPHVKKYYLDLKATDWAKKYVATYRKPRNTPEIMQKIFQILGM